MAWVGIADKKSAIFNAEGLGITAKNNLSSHASDGVMRRGTLMLETRLSPDARPQTLLAFTRTYPSHASFSLKALPGGGIVLIESRGDDIRHVTLPHYPDGRMDVIRITYSWDAPTQWGRLTLERPETDMVHSVMLDPPRPFPLNDMRAIIKDTHQRELDEDVDFIAVSTDIEPVGPMPGLTGRLPVLTSNGYKYADKLRRGDMVETDQNHVVPVLQCVRRTVPARGSFRPVLIRAPYFGLRQDIVVAPHQRLVIRGSEVEYMFGKEAVLVPAQHLVNGVSTYYVDGPDVITYHQLLLPNHEAILAAGCPVESLYVGRLRRKPDPLAASLLAPFDRNRLPEHPNPIWPVLKPFDAITLVMHRAA